MLKQSSLQRRLKTAPFSQEFTGMLAPERALESGVYYLDGKVVKLAQELIHQRPQVRGCPPLQWRDERTQLANQWRGIR